jgi:hypothetical protein
VGDETEARPLGEWQDDDWPSLWWRFPVDEPPYVGGPGDGGWPGYHTHWTPIPMPTEPKSEKGVGRGG